MGTDQLQKRRVQEEQLAINCNFIIYPKGQGQDRSSLDDDSKTGEPTENGAFSREVAPQTSLRKAKERGGICKKAKVTNSPYIRRDTDGREYYTQNLGRHTDHASKKHVQIHQSKRVGADEPKTPGSSAVLSANLAQSGNGDKRSVPSREYPCLDKADMSSALKKMVESEATVLSWAQSEGNGLFKSQPPVSRLDDTSLLCGKRSLNSESTRSIFAVEHAKSTANFKTATKADKNVPGH
ncbi:hypothetical protein HZS_7114, partial [Henneguya salminicola]